MTDTPRTRTSLVAIFADNNAQEITAQDVRDFLASVPLTTEPTEYGTAAAHPIADFASSVSPAFTGTPTGIGIPVYSYLTGSNSTSAFSFVSTGLTVPVVVGTYEFEANIVGQPSEPTNGCTFTIGGVGGTGTIEGVLLGAKSGVLGNAILTTFDENTGAWLTGFIQSNTIIMKGIVNITTPTNLSVKYLKIIGGNITIQAYSYLKVTRIA